MKKRLQGLVAGILVGILLATGVTAFATVASKTVEIFYKDIKISLDGKEVTPTDANGNTVEPFIMNGTTYLPLRAVANMVGLYVGWDAQNNTAILSTTELVKTVEVADAINYEKGVITLPEAKEMGISFDDQKHIVKLPKIIRDTENAKKLNDKIYNQFAEIINRLKNNQEYGAMFEITYTYSVNKDILSIVVNEAFCAQLAGGHGTDYVYHYDIANDKEISFEEYISILGVSKTDLENLMKGSEYYEYEIDYGPIKFTNCVINEKETIIYYYSYDFGGEVGFTAKPL